MAHSEERYLLNRLYIDSYCVWLQSVTVLPDAEVAKFAEKVRGVTTCVLGMGCRPSGCQIKQFFVLLLSHTPY